MSKKDIHFPKQENSPTHWLTFKLLIIKYLSSGRQIDIYYTNQPYEIDTDTYLKL